MKQLRPVLPFCVVALVGCGGPQLVPEQFLTVDQAFKSGAEIQPPAAASNAIRKGLFAASYEDVFRAATVAASQAQLNVERADKSKGLILATRSVPMVPAGTDYLRPTEHIFYYAITVKELEPKQSEVTIASKVQGQCSMAPVGTVTVFSLGTATAHALKLNEKCTSLSNGMWAVGTHGSGRELGQFQTFLRNNLIAAGVL